MNKIKTMVGIGILSLASFGMYEFGKYRGTSQERERIVVVLENKVKEDLKLAGENYAIQRIGDERETEFGDCLERVTYADRFMKKDTLDLPLKLLNAVINDKNDSRTLYHLAEAHARTEVVREIISGENQFAGSLVSKIGLK